MNQKQSPQRRLYPELQYLVDMLNDPKGFGLGPPKFTNTGSKVSDLASSPQAKKNAPHESRKKLYPELEYLCQMLRDSMRK
jgi:hypothetical protein